jgi:PDZ domain-containing secreted protein
LTSVIPQAPITAGEWLIGHLSPVVKIVPPASVVPDNTTPQELAKQGFQMLDQSETTAIVVGLRLAGYQTEMVGKGVEISTIEFDNAPRPGHRDSLSGWHRVLTFTD